MNNRPVCINGSFITVIISWYFFCSFYVFLSHSFKFLQHTRYPTLKFQISLSCFSLCTRINMPVINRGHHLHSPIYLSCTNLISSSVIRMLHITRRTSLAQVRSRDRPGQLTSQIFSSLAKVTKSIVEKRREEQCFQFESEKWT
jgi:hypothetical protein